MGHPIDLERRRLKLEERRSINRSNEREEAAAAAAASAAAAAAVKASTAPPRPAGRRTCTAHPSRWLAGRETDGVVRVRLGAASVTIQRISELADWSPSFRFQPPSDMEESSYFTISASREIFTGDVLGERNPLLVLAPFRFSPPSPTRVVKHGALKGIRFAEATPDRTLRRRG